MCGTNSDSHGDAHSDSYCYANPETNFYSQAYQNPHSHTFSDTYAHPCSRRNRAIPHRRRQRPYLWTSEGWNCRLLGRRFKWAVLTT